MDFGQILTNAVLALLGIDTIVFALAAIGLNIQFGYSGLLNFGQSGFVAVGAYGLATMVTLLHLPTLVGVAVGLLGAVVLALLLGIPTLRLRADYLAICTIAAAEIVRLLARAAALGKYTGGSNGLTNFSEGFYSINPFPKGLYGFGSVTFNERFMWVQTVGWSLVALFCLMVWLLMRSPWGRVLKGIREDEDAVRSLGKDVYMYKMQALILGGVIGAVAGFIFAWGRSAVQPDLFSTDMTFFAYTILLLGGAARVFGPVVGSALFWVVLSLTDNILGQLATTGPLQGIISTNQVGQIRFILVGVTLMLLMIYRPQGIFGDKREIAIDAR